ncbi:SDR family NAD(P)-dependent oxidoreductase [Amycolatopsis magusensis]|uniref:SDR family NAD(P)-dependent oxidoreductase n=1 Tax=Amycolatopsis magusensis TaxID=882444 RepID=UPI00379E8A65
MTNAPILVLGGLGKTGRRVTDRLEARGLAVRPVSRSTPIRFDWADESTWDAALAGTGALYLVPPAERWGTTPIARLLARAGQRRAVLLSARGADFAGEPVHEREVRENSPEWTILRPSWFAHNFSEGEFAAGIDAGRLALPTGDGRDVFVDAEDIADVAVAALTEDGHAGQVYELSGPQPLSFPDAVARIAEASGRRIEFAHCTPAEFAATVPSPLGELLATLLSGVARNVGDHVSDGVRRALGREPRSFEDFVARTFTSEPVQA